MNKTFDALIIIALLIIIYLLIKINKDLSNRIKIIDIKANALDRAIFLIADKYYPERDLIFKNRQLFYSTANKPITKDEVDVLSTFASNNKIIFPLMYLEEDL